MSLALAAVMLIAGWLLYSTTTNLVTNLQQDISVAAAKLMLEQPTQGKDYWQEGIVATPFDGGKVKRFEIRLANERMGYLYQAQHDDAIANLIVPQELGKSAQERLLGLVLGISSVVILVGALVAFLIASQVSSPLHTMIEDIRRISHGDLRHRTRVKSGGEIALLAKTIDRMSANLSEAQEAELELSMRDRELEVAGEVREALLPQSTPKVSGWDLASAHLSSPEPGGDFHEFIEYPDGRVGVLVCDVSGVGVPGALVGATARSYLRSILPVDGDVEAAFKRANRELARDVRRGMYVTAMYALLEPDTGHVTLVCAGHKVPAIHVSRADGKVRLVQPEGIALGFDKGPVFDRSLGAQTIELEPGDRLVVSTTGPMKVIDPDGSELGDKGFYKLVARHGKAGSERLLAGVRADLEAYAGDEPLPADISLIALARDSA